MAFMNQERKAKLAPGIKDVLKKYNVKGSLAVRHHSSLVLNLKSGSIDFVQNAIDTAKENHKPVPENGNIGVNPYWFHEHYTGKALDFLTEILAAMNVGNHDKSDISSDYFDVGWYVDVNIGQWNKPYIVTK